MKKISPILLVVIFLSAAISVMAQGDKKEDLPPGMEIIQIKGAKFVVPKGTIVNKKGDLIILEAAHEYVARKVEEIEERLTEIEAKEEELNQKIEQLNKAVSEIQKNYSDFNKKEGRSELLNPGKENK